MAFAIVDPALLAALLAATAPVYTRPAPQHSAVPACGAGQTSTTGFDCCLHLTMWNSPASTSRNTSAQSSSDPAADQKEGR